MARAPKMPRNRLAHRSEADVARIVLAVVAVLLVIFLVPFAVYSVFASVVGLEVPQGASPAMFLLGVFISKIGTAVTFVGLYHVARSALAGRWLLYATLWWVMFALGEVGQTLGPDYSWMEALAGVISETVYLPLSAFIVHRLLTAR
jgi:hypothetical protein